MFTFNGKKYQWISFPFGMWFVGGVMQQYMDNLLADITNAFQDNVIIGNRDLQQHYEQVVEVLKRLTYTATLKVNVNKCKFFLNSISILGYSILSKGITM